MSSEMIEIILVYLRLVLHPLLAALLLMASAHYQSIKMLFYGFSAFFVLLFVINIFVFFEKIEFANELRLFLVIPIQLFLVVTVMRILVGHHKNRIGGEK